MFDKLRQFTVDFLEMHKLILVTVLFMTVGIAGYVTGTGPASAAASLVQAEAISKTQIYVDFSEAVDPAQAGNPANYSIPGLTISAAAVQTGSNNTVVVLTSSLQTPGVSYNLTVSNVITPPGTFNNIRAFNPHGLYGINTNLCADCHATHTGLQSKLLGQNTEETTCFLCHDAGGQSQYSVKSEFQRADAGAPATKHPVVMPPTVDSVLHCSACHNPHGDYKTGSTMFGKLLRARGSVNQFGEGAGIITTRNETNEFCFICHGSAANTRYTSTPPAGDPTYWSDSGGDHGRFWDNAGSIFDTTNVLASHYDITKSKFAAAPNNNNITCIKCHERHGSQYRKLLNNSVTGGAGVTENQQEYQCFACHDNTLTTGPKAWNVKGQFVPGPADTSMKHDLDKVSCTNCHGPHTVVNAAFSNATGTSDISDPANTKKMFVGTGATADKTAGRYSVFCVTCHKGSGWPTQVFNSTTVVPLNLTWPATRITTHYLNTGGAGDNYGYDKSQYTATAPYIPHYDPVKANIECNYCHEPHVSTELYLTKAKEQNNCNTATCHGASGTEKITNALGRASKHPVDTVDNQHTNTENYNNMALANRHAECTDCHDPHVATTTPASNNTNPRQPSTALAGGVSGPIINVTGAIPAARTEWQNTTFTFDRAAKQYEICYKCHTSYSFNLTAPFMVNNAGAQQTYRYTDIAREFNPNNMSHHGVEAAGKNLFTEHSNNITAALINSWTPSSILLCTDCHYSTAYDGTTSGDPKGPHGSAEDNILGAKYDSTTGTAGTSTHLCFKCHSWNALRVNNTAPGNSNFKDNGGKNLHVDQHSGYACQACHLRTIHGAPRPHLIGVQADGAPWVTINSNWLVQYSEPATGQYAKNNCKAGCTGDHSANVSGWIYPYKAALPGSPTNLRSPYN